MLFTEHIYSYIILYMFKNNFISYVVDVNNKSVIKRETFVWIMHVST